jgi:hypothetical protein
MASAAARSPDGSGTAGNGVHPTAGPPMASSRSDSSSADAGDAPGPAAHTTMFPPPHDAWSLTSPVGSAAAMAATTEELSPTFVSRS